MIKTLQITGIITVVLAVGFIVFPAVFGVRSDEQIKEFLSSPGAIEKFKNKTRGDKNKSSESQVSPLVTQAQAFALYLNPPAPPKKEQETIEPRKASTTIRPASVTAKFKLIATCYYALHPDSSLALIDEPGKGLYWVRQSSKVGHLIIEQVKDGLVVYQDGPRTREQLVEPRPGKTSLLKKEASVGQTGPKPTLSALDKLPFDKSASDKTGAGTASSGPLQASAEEIAASMEMAIKQLKAMQAMQAAAGPGNAGPQRTEENTTLAEAISAIEVMRVSAEEATRLDRLGKELKSADAAPDDNADVRQDPNQAEDRSAKRARRTKTEARQRKPSRSEKK